MPENLDATYDAIGCPKTCREALQLWDDNKTVRSPEMGGLGPGYEQAIQILIFEIVREGVSRDWVEADLEDFKAVAEKAISRCSGAVGGFSGAMVGAAKSVAWNVLRKGWRAAILELPKERIIGVRKVMPFYDGAADPLLSAH